MDTPRSWPWLLTALALSACAGTGDYAPAQPARQGVAGDEVRQACFVRSMDGFSQARDDSVIVHLGRSRQYLVETFGYCPDLSRAWSLGVRSLTGCISAGDQLLIYTTPLRFHPSPGGFEQASFSCRISRIREWRPGTDTPEADAAD